MRDDALARAAQLGARIVAEGEVQGTFDLPLAASVLLHRKDIDGVVALGAVVTGETKHDELIAHACAHALTRLAVETGKPIGLGVTGPGQTYAQAQARVDRAGAAVESVVKQLQTLRRLRKNA